MASKNFGKVNVSITASTGGLTAGLAQASKKLSGFRSTVGGMGGMFSTALSGALGLGRGATIAAVGVSVLTASLRALLAPLAIVAAVTAPFVAFARAAAAAEQLHNLSQELQVTTGNLQVLQAVGGEFGLSTEQMTGALRRSTRMVSELAAGTPAAQKAFAQLGLTMNDLAGLDASQQFALIADRIAALPPEMQAAAAIDIFGRSGQSLLPFLRQGGEGLREMDTLLTNLGVKMSGPQVAAIEAMGDSLGRLILPVQGFINQFLAGVAPAIKTVADMFLEFITDNTQGWSLASSLAAGFTGWLKLIVGTWTILYGVGQVFWGVIKAIGGSAGTVFGLMLQGIGSLISGFAAIAGIVEMVGKTIIRALTMPIQGLIQLLADAASAVGMTGISKDLQKAADAVGGFGQGDWGLASSAKKQAAEFKALGAESLKWGASMGKSAGESIANGMTNIMDPFQDFDERMAKNKADAEKAAVKDGAAAGAQTLGNSITAAVRASSAELKAIVVGSSDGESFRNSIMRGADPRLDVKEDAKRTADNTERTADTLDEMASNLTGFGLATLTA
jgi:hypothetical protein